jgi:hypothetical protein
MRLKALKWICGRCGGFIETPEDGWLEWRADKDDFKYGDFKTIHHAPKSPYKENGGDCDHYRDDPAEESSSLTDFLGADGMARLTTWVYAPGVKDLSDWAELVLGLG